MSSRLPAAAGVSPAERRGITVGSTGNGRYHLDPHGNTRVVLPSVHTIDGLHVLAFVILGLTIGHAVLAIAEHYFPGSEGVVAGRFILGGAC
jgi:hypothetical protein